MNTDNERSLDFLVPSIHELVDFLCPRCGEPHPSGEPGFAWPDATFSLSIPAAEQAAIRNGENEDVLVLRDESFFVRGVLKVTSPTRPSFSIGLWIQISRDDFEDFERRGRVGHPSYTGRIANQCFFLAPLLGAHARMDFAGEGLRPQIVLLDPAHPLSIAQRDGVDDALIDRWRGDEAHLGEPEPIGSPFQAALSQHGFELVLPTVAGRSVATPSRQPEVGDQVKVVVAFLASDERGNITRLTAGWWVELDAVAHPNLWGATLANVPRVPATINEGSRLWLQPHHVIEYALQR